MAEYLICLDFEATCNPSKNQRYKGWYQEIVDFGAVLLDLSSGEIESEFQSYVNPTEFYVTRGCFRKLGISQEALNNSLPLQTVLGSFGKWMRDIRDVFDLIMPCHQRMANENAYFCTWSNMDLSYYLRNECERKDISYAHYLKWWIDGQEIFHDTYERKPKLHDAASWLGTHIIGNSHTAIDDAKTLALIVNDLWNKQSLSINVYNCR